MSWLKKRKKAKSKKEGPSSEDGEKEMSFVEHLEELRWHLIRSLIAIVIFAVLAFIFRRFVFDYIILVLDMMIFLLIGFSVCFQIPLASLQKNSK